MDIIRSSRSGTSLGRINPYDDGWTMPVRGIRARDSLPVDHELLTRSLIGAADRLAVACDLTAAHLWSAVVPSGFGLDVDAQRCAVATVRDGNRLQSSAVRGRRLELPSDHLTTLNGIPITTPARTWFDCSALVTMANLVAMGDALLRDGLSTREELQRVVAWGRGRRGVRLARWALPVLDPGSESPGESWVRAILVHSGLPAPECNMTVRIFGYEFRLDIAWRQERVAVEYDGAEWHGPEQRARDEWRRELLRRAGWTVIVIRKEDLMTPNRLNDAVWQALGAVRATRSRSRNS